MCLLYRGTAIHLLDHHFRIHVDPDPLDVVGTLELQSFDQCSVLRHVVRSRTDRLRYVIELGKAGRSQDGTIAAEPGGSPARRRPLDAMPPSVLRR